MKEEKINVLVDMFLEGKDVDIEKDYLDLQAGPDVFYEISLGDDHIAIMGESDNNGKVFLFYETLLESDIIYSLLRGDDRIEFIKILYNRIIDMLGDRLPDEGYGKLVFSFWDFVENRRIKFTEH